METEVDALQVQWGGGLGSGWYTGGSGWKHTSAWYTGGGKGRRLGGGCYTGREGACMALHSLSAPHHPRGRRA
eukprot:scaffold11310_cov107-Isochrysis_galbana.AAC.2